MELFDALEAALGKLPIIAEDLGDLVPSVRSCWPTALSRA